MKGAFLIGASVEDLERVGDLWRSLPQVRTSPDVVQWDDSGFLFNVFTEVNDCQQADWQQGWRDSPSTSEEPPAGGVAWWIECRSEDVFARILREASALAPGRLWVLDDDDVLWPAEAIDPRRILL